MNEEKVEGLRKTPPPGYRFKTARKRGSTGGTSPLPEGMQYVGGCGNAQRLRNLKRSWKAFEKAASKNAVLRVVRENLLDAVAGQVSPADEELACYIAVHVATVQSRDTGKPIEEMIERAIDELNTAPRASKSWTHVPGA